MRKNWNDSENSALIALYKGMRSAVDSGSKYNKAALIREAQTGTLAERTRGSIEAKMMNLTAILHDIGKANQSLISNGYKAAPNYQQALKDAAIEAYKS